MNKAIFICVFLLSAAAHAQTGPCTSTATIPPPTNAPFAGLTGAGTYVANPEPANYAATGCFGPNNPLLRVSDANTPPSACTAQGVSCTSKTNQTMGVNPGNGAVDQWTCFGPGGSCSQAQFVTNDTGGVEYIWDFNGMTTPPTVHYTNYNFALKFWLFPSASKVTPKLWYSFANAAGTADGPVLKSYDTSQVWPTLPTATTIYDFTSSVNCVPSSAINKTDPVGVDPTDSKFGTGFSTSALQNTAVYVAQYVKGSGCSMWETDTSTVTGDYGTTGAATCQNCPGGATDPGHFNIHNVEWSRDLTYAIVQPETCLTTCYNNGNPYFWQPSTNKVWVSCTAPHCSGHFLGGGQNIFANRYNAPYWQAVNFGSTTPTLFPPSPNCQDSASPQNDQHTSYINNIDDTQPFWMSNTTGFSNPVYNACNVAEITALYPPTNLGLSGTMLRAAHNYGAATSQFQVQNQIMTVSPDGNYALMTSPMANATTHLGQLGDVHGNYPCPVQADCRGDVFMVQLNGAATLAPSPMFGFTETNTSPSNFPTVSYGMQRFWDSPPLQWPSINTASGVFNFTNLDTALATSYAAGQREAMYTLARTPPWASSNPSDTLCHYQLPAVGGGPGECYPPTDLNADGSGTNAIWKAWITALATHANNQTYLQTHAHIRYYEIWNEPDSTGYWMGSFAQLARLTEDANCIITGRGVVHQNGDGSATTCTATPIDPTAVIIMSSGHASSPATLKYAQNQLYCSNTSGIPSYQLPCPNPATATSAAIDVVNFHIKPGNATGNNCPPPSTPCIMESAFTTFVANAQSVLQPAELAKPFWDGEVSYAEAGFIAPYNDPDMGASLMPRMYLMMQTLGISGSAWYTWDNLNAQNPKVATAYQQAYNYLIGSSLTGPCSPTLSIWACTISTGGVSSLILWDTSQSCSGGSCTTSNVTVPTQWVTYQDMTAPSSPIAIAGHTVPVGIKPVILQSGTVSSLPPAPAILMTEVR